MSSRIKCAVVNCPGGIRLYAVPEVYKHEWAEKLNMDVEKVNKKIRVCDRHFNPKWFCGRKLKVGAIPTRNLGLMDGCVDTYSSENIEKKVQVIECCIVNCEESSPASILHSFPENPVEKAMWKAICDVKKQFRLSSAKFICTEHLHFVQNSIKMGYAMHSNVENTANKEH